MTTKPKDIAQLPQEEVVIDEPQVEAPAELREMAEKGVNNLIGMWNERRADQQARLESGEFVLPGGYKYWDCLLLGPYQPPAYDRPAKIIAANEWAYMIGLIWINQLPDPAGGVSGAQFFAFRPYNACFRAIRITNILNVNSHIVPGTFGGLAPQFTPIYWYFQAPDPGPNPAMYEVHFAVDLTQANLPFATFATWHWDPENDGSIPGWPGHTPTTQPMPAHFDHDIPARFLVYHK